MKWVRSVPLDLAVCAITVPTVAVVTLIPLLQNTLLRIPIGLGFVLFVPGYAFVAALFPEAPAQPNTEDDSNSLAKGSGISILERIVLSFGTSIAIVPLLGLLLNFTPWGVRLFSIVLTLGGFTLGAVAVAHVRRHRLPPGQQFDPALKRRVCRAHTELFSPQDRTDTALNVLLVVSVLLAVSSVAYAVTAPNDGEQFTELYLLTETEDGDLVADDYPTNFTAGESQPIVVGVSNHEGESVKYSLAIELQRVHVHDENIIVVETERLAMRRYRVRSNETWHERLRLEPKMSGERLRLTFLLYRGTVPENSTTENAYREVHLWVNVRS